MSNINSVTGVEQAGLEQAGVEQEEAPGRLSRRHWLKTTGGAALLLPLVQLAGCSDDAPSKPAAAAPKPSAAAAPKPMPKPAPAPEPAKAAPAAAESAAAPAAGGSAGLVKIDVNDPVAKALSYTADAANVDSSKHPRFAAGQHCGNCAQYKAQGEDGWGSCAIFPGKLVAKKAWCSGFIAVS